MSGNDRIGLEQSRAGVIMQGTGAPKKEDYLDPNNLRGHDLLTVLAIQGVSRIIKTRGVLMLTGRRPVKVFEGGTYPQVVTFRTGCTIIPGTSTCILLQRFGSGQPEAAGLTPRNAFPLSLNFADEHTIIVNPGEAYWAALNEVNPAEDFWLTVMEKSIILLK